MKNKKIICLLLVCVTVIIALSSCAQRKTSNNDLITLESYNISDNNLLYTAKTKDLRYIKYNNCITITEVISDNIDIIIPGTIENLPVVAIEEDACANNEYVQRVTIGPNVVSIGSDAFKNCKSLISVQMSGSVAEIGSGAFSGCESLRSIIIPAAVDNIESDTFSGCTSLKKAVIESRTSSDEPYIKNRTTERKLDSAFSGCASLAAIWIPADISTVESSTLGNNRTTVVFSEIASSAAIFAAHGKLDFGITTRNEFDMAARQYNPIEEDSIYDQPGRTISTDKLTIRLAGYDFFTAVGTEVSGEGNHFIRVIFDVINEADYPIYFDGYDCECYSWARDKDGIMRTYVKNPLLVSKNISEYSIPAGTVQPYDQLTCAIILKVNIKSACVSIKFKEANEAFYIR